MRKHLKKIIAICFLILASACLLSTNRQVVFADIVEEDLYQGYIISSTHMPDEYLYSELLKVAKKEAKNLGLEYTSDSISSETFVVFNLTELEINNRNITSLKGLERLEGLENLERLILPNNAIDSIEIENTEGKNINVLKSMENLVELDLSNNKLKKIDINDCSNLTKVNLSGNNLTEAVADEILSDNLELNLNNNKFTDMANIKLPLTTTNINLSVFSNDLADIDSEYWEMSNLKISAGLQGFKDKEIEYSFSKDKNLKVFNIGNERLSINIYKDGENEPYKNIKSSDITNGVLNVNLPIGAYKFVYALDGVDINPKTNKEYAYLMSNNFTILPSQGTHKFEHKGKIYEADEMGKVTGRVKVIMSCEEGGVIFYSINGSEWVEGNEAICDGGGNFSVLYKVVKDGFESETTSIFIRTSLNTVLSDGIMLAIAFFLMLVLFLVIVPFVSKKFFRKK